MESKSGNKEEARQAGWKDYAITVHLVCNHVHGSHNFHSATSGDGASVCTRDDTAAITVDYACSNGQIIWSELVH